LCKNDNEYNVIEQQVNNFTYKVPLD